MYTKETLGICTACAVFLLATSLPVDPKTTKIRKIYQVVPLEIGSLHTLPRIRRDVFPENINDQKEMANHKAETHHAILLTKKGDNGVLKGEQKETLTVAADTIYPVVYRITRASENRRRYDDSDDDYDDSDYAGYDKKGSDVGYMDSNDDFPTVVW